LEQVPSFWYAGVNASSVLVLTSTQTASRHLVVNDDDFDWNARSWIEFVRNCQPFGSVGKTLFVSESRQMIQNFPTSELWLKDAKEIQERLKLVLASGKSGPWIEACCRYVLLERDSNLATFFETVENSVAGCDQLPAELRQEPLRSAVLISFASDRFFDPGVNLRPWLLDIMHHDIALCSLAGLEVRIPAGLFGSVGQSVLSSMSLVDLIAEQPDDAIVVECNCGEISQKELGQLCSAIQSALSSKPPLARVAMHVNRCHYMVACIIAVLRAGCVLVPFDKKHRLDSQQLRSLNICVVLSDDNDDDECGCEVFNVVDLSCSGDSTCGAKRVCGYDPAVILFTSGSTGKPKGVELAHAGLCNFVLHHKCQFPLSNQDRVLLKTPITFDGFLLEVFWALSCRCRLVVAGDSADSDAPGLVELMRVKKIAAALFVPTWLEHFLHVLSQDLPCLKYVCVGGEDLPQFVVEDFFRHFQSCTLVNMYGPVEASVDVLQWVCRPGGKVKIGCPVRFVDCTILEDGELVVAGPCVAIRYLSLSEEPAPTLARHNSVQIPLFQNQFYTGDIVHKDEHGDFFFVGRGDDVLKLGGRKVSLSQIRSLVAQEFHDCVGIVDCVNQVVVVYLIIHHGRDVNELVLRGRKNLHAFVRIYVVLWTERLFSAHGKISLQALRQAVPCNRASNKALLELERACANELCDPWYRLSDDLAILGCSSLMYARMSFLCSEFGFHVSPHKLMCFHVLEKCLSSGLQVTDSHEQMKTEVDSLMAIPSFDVGRGRQRVLVTGASSFIGRAVCEALRACGLFVIRLLHRRSHRTIHGADCITGDISLDRLGLSDADYIIASSVDCVVHTACRVDLQAPMQDLWGINGSGTVNVMKFCARHKLACFWLPSREALACSSFPAESSGYLQVQFAVLEAARKLPFVHSIALGYVSGDVGFLNDQQLLPRYLKSVKATKCAIDDNTELAMVSVLNVARGVAEIVVNGNMRTKFCEASGVSLYQIGVALNATEFLAYPQWLKRVHSLPWMMPLNSFLATCERFPIERTAACVSEVKASLAFVDLWN
jgi:acyl-coenzyme A synthetase/AMP-(fatty) acid ligase